MSISISSLAFPKDRTSSFVFIFLPHPLSSGRNERGGVPPSSPILGEDTRPGPGPPIRPPHPRHLRGLHRLSAAVQVQKHLGQNDAKGTNDQVI